jgi:hypothetical protein
LLFGVVNAPRVHSFAFAVSVLHSSDDCARSHLSQYSRHCTAVSLDNLPRINQRCQVQADNVNLQLGAVDLLNHGPNDGVINLTAIQIDADFIADLEFRVLVLWPAREGRRKCALDGDLYATNDEWYAAVAGHGTAGQNQPKLRCKPD